LDFPSHEATRNIGVFNFVIIILIRNFHEVTKVRFMRIFDEFGRAKEIEGQLGLLAPDTHHYLGVIVSEVPK
jgi:hypothetical protein